MRARLTRPGPVVALVVVAAFALVAGGSRTWVSGTTDDAVLGAARVAATGTESVGGLAALALAAGAAAIAAATAGRIGRVVALVALAGVTAGLGVLLGRVLTDPAGTLGRVAARRLGRTGTLQTHATLGAWPWVAAAATVLLAVATVLAVLGARSWRGLSGRYEKAPSEGGPPAATGARGQRADSAWEQLSAGRDPTDDDAPPQT